MNVGAMIDNRQTRAAAERAVPLPLREDTILGVCEAIGEDFGFNANWLRVLLAAGLLWNAAAIVGIYLGLGAIVAASRLLFPTRRTAPEPATAVPPQASTARSTAVEEIDANEEPELVAA